MDHGRTVEKWETQSLTRECKPSSVPLTLSYFHGVCEEPLSAATLGHVLVEAATGRPDHVIFRTFMPQASITISELKRRADQASSAFLKLGLKKGDVVFITGVGDIEYYILFFAITQIGLTFFFPFLSEPEDMDAEQVMKVEAAAIVIGTAHSPLAVKSIENYVGDRKKSESTVPHIISVNTDIPSKVTALKGFILSALNSESKSSNFLKLADNIEHKMAICRGYEWDLSVHSYDEFLKLATVESRDLLTSAIAAVSIDDAAMLLRTSGSATMFKTLVVTHHILVNMGYFTHQRMAPFTNCEVISLINPVLEDTCSSLQITRVLCNWKLGLVAVMAPPDYDVGPYDTEKWLQLFENEKVTWHAGLPFELIFAVNFSGLSKYDISSVRGASLLGQAIGEAQKKQILKQFPDSITLYGSTEAMAGLGTSVLFSTSDQRMNSAGYPFPHCEVKIVDRDGGIVPVGRTGEICVRGWTVFKEYRNNDPLTREAKDPKKCGWHFMGDIGVMDESGHVTYIGRTAECVRFKSFGDQIYPKHILDAMSGYSKVKEAKVIGVPNDILGDDVCLCVEPQPNSDLTEKELKKYCEEKLVFRDRPNYFFIFEVFPRTGSRNKVALQKLQAMVEEKLRVLRPLHWSSQAS